MLSLSQCYRQFAIFFFWELRFFCVRAHSHLALAGMDSFLVFKILNAVSLMRPQEKWCGHPQRSLPSLSTWKDYKKVTRESSDRVPIWRGEMTNKSIDIFFISVVKERTKKAVKLMSWLLICAVTQGLKRAIRLDFKLCWEPPPPPSILWYLQNKYKSPLYCCVSVI